MTAALITSPKHRVDIAPGLTLTSDLFEIAAAGIAQHMPDFGPLRWEDFISRQWTLVPDELTGEPYKAELHLSRFNGLNYWLAPDRRGGEEPKPHNHPWDFHSATLAGLLVEDRVVRVGDDLIHTSGVEHRAGDINRVGRETFHEVVDLEPQTLTLMMYGPGMNHWGYLDADGNYTKAVAPKGVLGSSARTQPAPAARHRVLSRAPSAPLAQPRGRDSTLSMLSSAALPWTPCPGAAEFEDGGVAGLGADPNTSWSCLRHSSRVLLRRPGSRSPDTAGSPHIQQRPPARAGTRCTPVTSHLRPPRFRSGRSSRHTAAFASRTSKNRPLGIVHVSNTCSSPVTPTGLLVQKGSVLNVPGSVNRIFDRDYHEVKYVAEPGRTVSVIVCGRWIHDEAHKGIWGHLDLVI